MKFPYRTFLLALLFLSSNSFGQEDFFQDIDVANRPAQQASQNLTIFGWFEEKAAYGLEAPDAVFSRHESKLGMLESSVFTQLDWQAGERLDFRFSAKYSTDQIYHLQGKHNFSFDEINEFQSRLELKDLYLDARLSDRLYLKFGHQIIAWGMAENLRISDRINTLNRYTLGHQDLEDLRLQVPAARLTYNIDDWTLEGIVTYRAGKDDYPPAFDEFDPLIRLREDNIALHARSPSDEFEYILHADFSFNGSDLSFTAADLNANNLSISQLSYSGSVLTDAIFEQDRFQLYALAANRVFGSWLIAAEAGVHRNRSLPLVQSAWAPGMQPGFERNQALGALNIQYNGFTNWTLTAEADAVLTRDFRNDLDLKREQYTYSLRVTRSLLNERIQLLALWNQSPGDDSEYARFGLDFDWSDRLELGLLWVYHDADSESPLFDFRHNDILQLSLRYSFQR